MGKEGNQSSGPFPITKVRTRFDPAHQPTPPDHHTDAILGPFSLAKAQHGQQALKRAQSYPGHSPTCCLHQMASHKRK